MEINRPQPFRPTSESIRQTPAPAARARQARSGSVLVGAWKMFMSALPGIFSPMTFFFHQRLVLWKAVVYATVPLLMAVLFYLVVPGQIAAYPLSNLSGWAYLAALFVASQIVFCLFLGLCHGIGAAVLAFANTARSHDRR